LLKNSLKFAQSKLYKLLNSLTIKEFNRLGDYINSPFFLKKNNGDVLKLYQVIQQNPSFITSKETLKETLFKKVYPNKPYLDKKIRTLFSKAVKIVDSYLLFLDAEANEFNRDRQLTTIYSKRNIYNEFVNNTKRLLSKLEKTKQRNTQYYNNKFLLQKNYLSHPLTNKNELLLLPKAVSSFHNYIALEQFNLNLEAINRSRMYQNSFQLSAIHYDDELTKDNLILQISKKIKNLLLKDKEAVFFEIKEQLEANLEYFNLEDRINIYVVLQNFAIQKGQAYIPHLLNIYKFGIKHDLILVNNQILDVTYINIVIVGLRNKEFKWTESFIKIYKSKLPKESRNFIKKLSLSYLYFEKEEYHEVIKIVSAENFPKLLFAINIRTIQLRSYFKLFEKDYDYYKPLMRYCDSFEKFLSREKSLVNLKKLRNKNFSRFVRKIANTIFRGKMSKRKRLNLLNELVNIKEINSKSWLIGILKEAK